MVLSVGLCYGLLNVLKMNFKISCFYEKSFFKLGEKITYFAASGFFFVCNIE